jgi:hypothetical protein
MTDRSKLFLIRANLVAGGLFLLAPPWKEWLTGMQVPPVWSESIGGLLRGVGEAFIVALVLELVVDPQLKGKLVKEILHDVAARIVSRLLPPKIFRHIEEQMLKANLVRTSWNITYTIALVQNNLDYVKLETESRYEMANLSPSPATYPAVYEVELPLSDVGSTEITGVTVHNLLMPAGAQSLVFQYPGCDPEDEPKTVGDYKIFSKSFGIPVHKTRSALEFVFRSTEHFHVGSIVPFFAKYLVEGTTLRVFYPKDKLRVIVDFPANKESEFLPKKESSDNDYYEFPTPILPGQGFTVRFPKHQ